MIAVLMVWAGLAGLAAGGLSLAVPLKFLAIRSRRAGAGVAGAGAFLAVAGALLPAPLERVVERRTRLDDFVPEFQFHERHVLWVQAPADRIFAAILGVTSREIRFFRTLTWLRSPRFKPVKETILAPSPDRPILDVALSSGFQLLAREPGREIVFGTVFGPRLPGSGKATPDDFARLDRPGYSKAAMNFFVEPEAGGWCRVTTETRIFSTDPPSRRVFAAYWRVISPGSAVIRRMWLRAIADRAARNPAANGTSELEAARGDAPGDG